MITIMVCTNVLETWVCCVKRNWLEVMYVACAERQKNVNHACCNVMLIVRSTWRQRWDHECEGWFAADFGVNVFSTAISGLVSCKIWYTYILCIVDCSQKFDSVLYHRADTVRYLQSCFGSIGGHESLLCSLKRCWYWTQPALFNTFFKKQLCFKVIDMWARIYVALNFGMNYCWPL